MKKFTMKAFVLLAALVVQQFAKADEGMWLPFMLGRNYSDMKKNGLKLTPEQIYSINKSSLKDAVISFGGFCTGEIISDNSLILTNHHCGYDAIAGASTPEHNYLDNGFWAKNFGEEIPVQGLTATFIVRMEDVTATIMKELNDGMTLAERRKKIAEISKKLEEQAVEGTHYEAFVRDFYEGNEFYLFVKETFKDVRLVGTPPQSVGKFGGDTDNWMWPRHTGDFSMFRIYAGKDNKPAEYNTDNTPYKPKSSLTISLKGVKENDYAMVMGFPGRTNRFLSSFGVEQAINLEQPKIVEVRAKKLEVMKKYMDKDVAVRLKYSSKHAQVANYWKYFIGQSTQLKNNNVKEKKEKIEADFTKYAADKSKYQHVLSDMEGAYKVLDKTVYSKVYRSEFLFQVDINLLAYFHKLYSDFTLSGNTVLAERYKQMAQERAAEFYNERLMSLEVETLQEVLKMYLKDVPADQRAGLLSNMNENGINAFIARMKANSVFMSKERYDNFAKNFDAKTIAQDPLVIFVKDLEEGYAAATTDDVKEATDKLAVANRLFVEGLREMYNKKVYAPNANSTMRLTYGKVLPYTTNDGKKYDYLTTIDEMVVKEDPNNFEFILDPRVKEVYNKKDYGQYAEKGKLYVNFLSNNDITGGNSGSPVMNAKGELIGTAFDGNWEAMSGDIYFEPNLQRTISVDIRYTLWLVDKCYGAENIIKELRFAK
ncbi:MAG: S46 family peptidase [Flavobacteriia bacterium]|nr:S46 family peptidase [Flavobacteriia bacterium]OJX37543.1 MAG: hypothetical protein BGO87_00855 [Flavobacteriia bacterium 40-80]